MTLDILCFKFLRKIQLSCINYSVAVKEKGLTNYKKVTFKPRQMRPRLAKKKEKKKNYR